MGLPISALINDCDVLGLPVILVQSFGFMLKVQPDDHKAGEFGHKFLLDGEPICHVSTLGDVELVEKTRPNNYIVKCAGCYGLVQVETGKHLCSFFWPKQHEKEGKEA